MKRMFTKRRGEQREIGRRVGGGERHRVPQLMAWDIRGSVAGPAGAKGAVDGSASACAGRSRAKSAVELRRLSGEEREVKRCVLDQESKS
jgi:hypothetical protein